MSCSLEGLDARPGGKAGTGHRRLYAHAGGCRTSRRCASATQWLAWVKVRIRRLCPTFGMQIALARGNSTEVAGRLNTYSSRQAQCRPGHSACSCLSVRGCRGYYIMMSTCRTLPLVGD